MGFGQWISAGMFSFCYNGRRDHVPVFDTSTDGQIYHRNYLVEDGDQIRVNCHFRRGLIKIQLENLTKSWSVNGTFSGFTPNQALSQYAGMSIGNPPVGLPPLDSGAVPVTGVKVGGLDLDQTSPIKVVMVDGDGPVGPPNQDHQRSEPTSSTSTSAEAPKRSVSILRSH